MASSTATDTPRKFRTPRPFSPTALMIALTAAAIFAAATTSAHTKPRAAKELVRIHGTIAAGGTCEKATLVKLAVLGRALQICASDLRRIVVATEEGADEPAPTELDLQGERSSLARLRKAQPPQTVSILGEWRPGRRDLFLISLDLCDCGDPPPDN